MSKYRGSPHNESLYTRIMRSAEIADNGCWLWTKTRNSAGYGIVWWKKHYLYVHRVSHELFIGPIPEGWDVGHKCHDEAAHAGLCDGVPCQHQICLNPNHLKAETRLENLMASPFTEVTRLLGTTKSVGSSEYAEIPSNG